MAGRAAKAMGGKPRKKALHAPKGVTEGGQFVGRSSILHGIVRLLTGGGIKGSQGAPGSVTADPRMGFKRPRLLAQARKRGVKLQRGAPQRDVVAALRQQSLADRQPAKLRSAPKKVAPAVGRATGQAAFERKLAQDLLDNWEAVGQLRGADGDVMMDGLPEGVLHRLAIARGIPPTGPRPKLQFELMADAHLLANRAGPVHRQTGHIPPALAKLPLVWNFGGAPPKAGGRHRAYGPITPVPTGAGVDSDLSHALSRWRAGTGPTNPFDAFDLSVVRRKARKRGHDTRHKRKFPLGTRPRSALEETLLKEERKAVRARRAMFASGTSGDFHLNFDDPEIARLRAADHSGVVQEKPLVGGAMGDTKLAVFKDGTKAVVKFAARDAWGHDPVDQADAEQLAALLGRSFGAPVPPVFRRDGKTIIMGWVEGTEPPGGGWQPPSPTILDTDGARRLGLLDLMINQTDRHGKNWLIDADGNPVGIDHGLTFTELRAPGHPPTFHHEGFTRPFMSQGATLRWIDNDLTQADIAHVRAQIEALRPDFERLGRLDWHSFALKRLDAIGAHATGKFNRIAPGGPAAPPRPPRARKRVPAPRPLLNALAAVPARKRAAWLEAQPDDVLRELAAGFGHREVSQRFLGTRPGTRADRARFKQLGGQTGIDVMPREQLLAVLRPIHAPGVEDIAQQVWRDISGRQHDWQVGLNLKRQPVAVIREIARMQPDAVIAKFGGPDAVAKMPKPQLIRLLEPAIVGARIPTPRPPQPRPGRAAKAMGGGRAVRSRRR